MDRRTLLLALAGLALPLGARAQSGWLNKGKDLLGTATGGCGSGSGGGGPGRAVPSRRPIRVGAPPPGRRAVWRAATSVAAVGMHWLRLQCGRHSCRHGCSPQWPQPRARPRIPSPVAPGRAPQPARCCPSLVSVCAHTAAPDMMAGASCGAGGARGRGAASVCRRLRRAHRHRHMGGALARHPSS